MTSERNREGNKLTMLESAGKRTSPLPVWNDKHGYGVPGGTCEKRTFYSFNSLPLLGLKHELVNKYCVNVLNYDP